jgi:phospholipase A-2-activating protein
VGPVVERSGSIVTGGYDKSIIVWNGATGESELVLMGHEEAVVALAITAGGDIVSGSWDKTIRVWQNGEAVAVLRGHAQGVWGVAGAPNGDIWSSSADKTIKIWRGGHCIRTLSDGSDCMRGLRVVPGVGVLSASNDGIVRLYSFEGELLRQLHGHASFVYSVAGVPGSDLLLSGGEDCSVRVWSGDSCLQTLQFPSTVWDVTALDNGDFLVGCADWIARIYTRDSKRSASAETKAAFEKRLLEAAQPKENKVGDLDLANVPGQEALGEDGTAEGQTKVVRKADGKGAELWKWAGGRWEKVGDVMNAINKDAVGGGGGGKDFSFPVDLNGQKYQINMNRGDNVYETATLFIAENGLNEEFLDQIVDFLHANVPDGAGAKVPAAANRNNQELSYNPSPWAESGPPPAAAAAARKPVPQKPFPRTTFVLFDAPGNLAGLAKKAAEFGANAGTLAGLIPKLSKPGGAPVTAAEATEVARMLSFESGKRFPGLDLLRLLALNAAGAALVSDGAWEAALLALGGAGPEPMLALKFFANCVRFEPLTKRLGASLGTVLDRCADAASGPLRGDAKAVNALAVLLCNLAVLNAGDAEAKTQLVSVLGELVDAATGADQITVVAALGTVATKDEGARALIVDLEVTAKLEAIAKDAPARPAAEELLRLVRKMDVSH